jgi:hypothetical protein
LIPVAHPPKTIAKAKRITMVAAVLRCFILPSFLD